MSRDTLTPAGRRWAEKHQLTSMVANVALHGRDHWPVNFYEAAIQTCNEEGSPKEAKA